MATPTSQDLVAGVRKPNARQAWTSFEKMQNLDAEKSDTVDLDYIPKGLYIGVAGTLHINDMDGDEVAAFHAIVGYHPIRPSRIYTDTTCTSIVAGNR